MSGFVSFVSAGPGDPELLTLKAAARLRAADVVLYDDLAAGAILDHARKGATLVSVDDSALKDLKGVRVVRIKVFLGVVAEDEWTCIPELRVGAERRGRLLRRMETPRERWRRHLFRRVVRMATMPMRICSMIHRAIRMVALRERPSRSLARTMSGLRS